MKGAFVTTRGHLKPMASIKNTIIFLFFIVLNLFVKMFKYGNENPKDCSFLLVFFTIFSIKNPVNHTNTKIIWSLPLLSCTAILGNAQGEACVSARRRTHVHALATVSLFKPSIDTLLGDLSACSC